MEILKTLKDKKTLFSIIVNILFLAVIITFVYLYRNNQNEIAVLSDDKQELEETLKERDRRITSLENSLQREEGKNAYFEGQIEDLTDSVGQIDKIVSTDEELLQKYSKVYFLNEHYTPKDLDTIPEEYAYQEDKELQINEKVLPYLEDLMEEAEEDGIDLSIVSAFRSYGEQAGLKSQYVLTYGAGSANQFSAEQGYSEHQLGTTVDFTTESVGATFAGFQNTESYEWLQDNAHRFGFTLSYPEGNNYYQYEPWHWRFVGVELATRLYEDDLHFYDLSQREINDYIISLFD